MAYSTEKKYYKIKEVSELLDLPASTLRFWESQFSILKPHRNKSGTRFYTVDDLETLNLINYLIKDKGLKISAAQDAIKHNRTGISRQARAIEKLREIRNTLHGISEALHKMR